MMNNNIKKRFNSIINKTLICKIYRLCNEYEIDYNTAKEMIIDSNNYNNSNYNNKCILIDVRSPQEYRERHLEYSINIPFYNIKRNIQSIITDKQTCLILYCQSGNRSLRVINTLKKMGYNNLYSIKGGLDNI